MRQLEVGENCIMRNFIICNFIFKYILNDQVKEDELGRAWRRRRIHVSFWWKSQKERDH
jgi:hypothetical protein